MGRAGLPRPVGAVPECKFPPPETWVIESCADPDPSGLCHEAQMLLRISVGGIGLKAAAQWRECTTIPRRQHYAHALFLLVNREL